MADTSPKRTEILTRRVFFLLLLLSTLVACGDAAPVPSVTTPRAIPSRIPYIPPPQTLAPIDRNQNGWPDRWKDNADDDEALDGYRLAVDMGVGYDDDSSLLLTSLDGSTQQAQVFYPMDESPYLGRRVRLSGYLRSEEIQGWGTLALMVLGRKEGQPTWLAYDTMDQRPIVGTNAWRRYELVLDIPKRGASRLSVMISLAGKGRLWVDNLQVEVVGEEVPVTDMLLAEPTPQNLGFEEGAANEVAHWQSLGSHPWLYTFGVEAQEAHEGQRSGVIRSTTAPEEGSGLLLQRVATAPYHGRRLRLSASLKTVDVTGAATMQMVMVNALQPMWDTMQDRAIDGTTEWQDYEIVLDVAPESTHFWVAFELQGSGELWIDDVRLEEVGEEVALTTQGHTLSEYRLIQQQIFADLWLLVEQHYAYEDFGGLDWQAVRTRYRARLDHSLSQADFWETMREMVALLGDEHSAFLTPEEVQEFDTLFEGGDYAGIGVVAQPVAEENYLVVLYTFSDSPAEEAGIRPHDRLLSADGMPLCCTVEGEAFVGGLSGEAGSQVQVRLQTPGAEARELTLTRRAVVGQAQVVSRRLAGDIGYLFIPTFWNEQIGEQSEAAWRALSESGPLQGLVLDLRVNHGGALQEMEELLALFTDGTVARFQRRDSTRRLVIRGQDLAGSQTIPLVILVSESTESAAEMVTAVLQGARGATLIGTATAGNIETTEQYPFSDGSRLIVAVEAMVPPEGSDWEETGIPPDIEVPQGWDTFATDDDDLALKAALLTLQR